VQPGHRAAQEQAVRHVVRAVAQVGQREPGQPSLPLGDGLQVGQHLAGVVGVGQGVDHGDVAGPGEGLDALLAVRADHDRVDVARQHARGVLDGLAAAELAAARVDDHGVGAQLDDADLERQPRPGARLLEDHGDGLTAQGGRRAPRS
jgi:hypothetical protein